MANLINDILFGLTRGVGKFLTERPQVNAASQKDRRR